jgi:two-component system heavy metal sensor histidine kinase CusS
MTARLTLLYCLVAFAVLLIVTASLFWVLRNSIYRDDADALAREIIELTDLLRDPQGNAEMLALEVNPHRDNTSVKVVTFLRVWHVDGDVLVETQEMSRRLPRELFIGALHSREALHIRAAGAVPFLLMSTQIAGAPWGIDAAMDLSRDNELLVGYRTAMLIVLALGLLLSIAGGVWLTRRGLQPLFEITGVVQRIGVERLHERVGPERWPVELEDLARAFDAMLDRLEAPFTRLQQLSADLAHELRTPINALMGETEVALSKPRDVEEYRRVLESNLEDYARLARLIDNLLFLARAENAQTAIARTALDVRAELDSIVAFYDAMAAEREIAVVCDGELRGSFDSILLRRAVGNLLSNALRYTPQGGHIKLTCARDASGEAVISVADDGVGIAPDELPRVFERFYRADAARSQHDGGAGLGLAIVASIVNLHGGRIEIRSEPGVGTTVTMRFPSA